MTSLTDIQSKELDSRTSDGIEVTLLWYPATDTVAVTVADVAAGASFEIAVAPADALDAFHHPYALPHSTA
jgi:hypothetical protein